LDLCYRKKASDHFFGGFVNVLFHVHSVGSSWIFLLHIAMLLCVRPVCAAQNKSLVFILDGCRADGLEAAVTPNIDSLIDGTWSEGYRGAYAFFAQTIKDAQTSSGPNHTAIFTGVTAAKHRVTSNDRQAMSAVTYPDYFKLLEDSDPALNTVKLYTWGPTGDIPTGADFERWAGSADGSELLMTHNAVDILGGTFTEGFTADPDAMLAFFYHPDDLADGQGGGHQIGFSPSLPSYRAAIETVDAQIGDILSAVRSRPDFANENWQVVLTSDHGGFGTSHGTLEAHSFTIPFVVSSRTVQQGLLAGTVGNIDVTPTVLTHMGIDATQTFQQLNGLGGYMLDGRHQGDTVRGISNATWRDGLVTYLRMENDFNDSSTRGNGASIGVGNPEFIAGKFGQGLRIEAAAPEQEYVTLGNGSDFNLGTNSDFTVAMWYRAAGDQSAIVFGNKNGNGTGVALRGSLGLNIEDSENHRVNVTEIDLEAPNEWWFVAATFERDGNVLLYAGKPDGTLFFISNTTTNLDDLTSSLPLNIGQDGTGSRTNLRADVDDFAVWQRALSKPEVEQLFNRGAGQELQSLLIPEPPGFPLLAFGVGAVVTRLRRRHAAALKL
jgi:hypothetical protein